MSARDITLPNVALDSVLRNYQNRLMAATRRARYPGAVHMVETPSVTVPAIPTWADVLSVQLDSGRWMITGGHWSTSLSPGGDVPYAVYTQFYYGSTLSPVYKTGQPNGGPSTPTVDSSMPVWTINVPAPVTVVMRVRRDANLTSCSASDIYMIASPA